MFYDGEYEILNESKYPHDYDYVTEDDIRGNFYGIKINTDSGMEEMTLYVYSSSYKDPFDTSLEWLKEKTNLFHVPIGDITTHFSVEKGRYYYINCTCKTDYEIDTTNSDFPFSQIMGTMIGPIDNDITYNIPTKVKQTFTTHKITLNTNLSVKSFDYYIGSTLTACNSATDGHRLIPTGSNLEKSCSFTVRDGYYFRIETNFDTGFSWSPESTLPEIHTPIIADADKSYTIVGTKKVVIDPDPTVKSVITIINKYKDTKYVIYGDGNLLKQGTVPFSSPVTYDTTDETYSYYHVQFAVNTNLTVRNGGYLGTIHVKDIDTNDTFNYPPRPYDTPYVIYVEYICNGGSADMTITLELPTAQNEL